MAINSEQSGIIRVRYWVNKDVRGTKSTGHDTFGLNDAPTNVLLALREAINEALSERGAPIATPA